MSTFRQDLFADVGSDITSSVYFVGDAAELTVNLDIDSDTTVTIQGSSAQGFRQSIGEDEWSTLSTVVGATENEMYNVEPGFRWLRVLRETASTASLEAAVVSGRNVVWGRG